MPIPKKGQGFQRVPRIKNLTFKKGRPVVELRHPDQSGLFRLLNLEKLRPRHEPYRASEDVGKIGLSSYAQELIGYLTEKSQITNNENCYLFYLERWLPRGEVAAALNQAIQGCRIVDLGRMNTNSSVAVDTHNILTGAKRLAWTVLPAGRWDFSDIRAHFKVLSVERPDLDWDLARLDFAESMRPIECWIGQLEFSGYVCFVFDWTKAALLDHPIKGNACYVLHRNWKSLSHLSKFDLLVSHGNATTRVIHSRHWKSKAYAALKRI